MPGAGELPAALQAQVRAANLPTAAPHPDGSPGAPRSTEPLATPEPVSAPEEPRDVTVDSEAFSIFIANVKAQPEDSHLIALKSRESGSTKPPHIPDEAELKDGNLTALLQENRDTLQAITGGQENGQNTQGLIEGLQITLSDEQVRHNNRLVELSQEQTQYGGAAIITDTETITDKPEEKKLGRRAKPAETHDVVTVSIDTSAVPKVVEAEGQIQLAQADLAAKRLELDNYVRGNPPPPISTADQVMYRGLSELRRLSHEYPNCSEERRKEIDARVRELVADPNLKIPAKHKGAPSGDFEAFVIRKAEDDDGLSGYLTLRDPVDSAKDALKTAEAAKADAEKKSRRWAIDGGNPAISTDDASLGAGFREMDAEENMLNSVEDNIIRLEVFSAFLSNQYVPSEQNGELKLMGADQSTLKGVDLAIQLLQDLVKTSQNDTRISSLTGSGLQEVTRMLGGSSESVKRLEAIKAGLVQSLQDRFDPVLRLHDAKSNVGKIERRVLNDRLARMGITVTEESMTGYLKEVGIAVDSVVGKVQKGEITPQGDPEELYHQIVNALVGKTVTDSIQPRGQSSDSTPPVAGGAPPAGGETPPTTGAVPAGPDAAAADATRQAAELALQSDRENAALTWETELGESSDSTSRANKVAAEVALQKEEALIKGMNKGVQKDVAKTIKAALKRKPPLTAAEIQNHLTDPNDPARIILENMWKAGLSSQDMINRANAIFDRFAPVKSAFGMISYLFATLGLPMVSTDEEAAQGAGPAPRA